MNLTKNQFKKMVQEALGQDSDETLTEEELEERDEHPVETMDTAVMGKGMLYKGKKMKTPSQLSFGLGYSGAGIDEGKTMKITRKQLAKMINEEKHRLKESDVASDTQLAEKAKALGYYLGGFPGLAEDLAKVFKKHRRPESAEALERAFNAAQSELDMIYSSYD